MNFDPATAQDATTAEEALELAKAWANGTRSWWNLMMDFEARAPTGEVADGARAQTVIAAAQADAAEVAKYTALVPAFLAVEAASEIKELEEALGAVREAAQFRLERRQDLEPLLREMVEAEDSPCSLDHHGYCQEHGWFGEGECGTKRARRLLGLEVADA